MRCNVSIFTKRKQWLGNVDETQEPKPICKPIEQLRSLETGIEKNSSLSAMEQ